MSKENADLLLREAMRSGITDKRELALFMGQMQHESTNFGRMTENLNYKPERLLAIFGPENSPPNGRNGLNTIEEARAITAGGQESVGNAVYGGAWGAKNLGNTQEGDGWTYRGRGFTQLTGREAYETMGNKLGVDLVNNPNLAAEPEIAAKIAVQYWKDRVVSTGRLEPGGDEVRRVTIGINGGTNGLADRRETTKEWERKIDQGYLEQLGKIQPNPGGQGQSPGGGQSTKPADAMADGVLERGEKGPAVKAMQEQIIKAGITQVNGKPFTADSDFGQQTEAAVREYQRTRGLKVDGEAGPDTLKALRENAPAKAQPNPEPTSPTQGNGLNWPAPGNFKINDADKPGEGHGEFGTSRGGGTRTHKGVDIEGKVGDPIESFRPGTVIAVKPNNGAAGNMVTIDHGNGLTSTYMHLDKINAKVGQKVPEDIEVIGTMGRTGNTPKAGDTHLHFEIRQNGVAVDPMPYLKGAKDLDSPAAAKTELKQGDKGAQVEQLQTRLSDLGYTDAAGNKLKPDSDFGGRTKQAVEQFQRENGLQVTGVADKDTMRLVDKGMTRHAAADGELKPGEKGPDVRGFQTSLNELGYKGADGKPLKVDGEYGGNTQAAVSAFQKANGMPETGIADKATLDKVGESLTRKEQMERAPQERAPVQPAPDRPTSATGHETPVDRTPREPAAPTPQTPQINDPKHPDNKLYTQALSNLEQLGPNGGFKSRDEMERAAASVAADAKMTGLTQIDHIKPSKNGEGLIAIQGNDPWAPEAKRSFIDMSQATTQSIDQSTRMADAKKPEQTNAQQPNQQRMDGIDTPVQKDDTQTKPKSVMV